MALLKRFVWIAIVVLATAGCADVGNSVRDAAEGNGHSGVQLQVAPDHENGVYKTGQTVTFRITATRDGKPLTGEVAYEILLNGAVKVAAGKLKLKSGKAAVGYLLKEPGCLAATVILSAGDRLAQALAGAVVDPFLIRQSLAAPKDFDEFWARKKRELAAVPMKPRLTPVEGIKAESGPPVECFDVQLDCLGGRPVSGYFARPKGAKAKSLPAVLSLQAYGVHSSDLHTAWSGARQNMLAMDINAHGVANGKPLEYYYALSNGDLRGYPGKGIDSRETFYFLGMYLRVVRAIDFLTSQPQWNGKTLITVGFSQGAGQAIIAAGLDSRVSEVRALLPSFCDQTAVVLNRKAGWPGPGWPPTQVAADKRLRTLQYFDACNFAVRIRAKVTIIVGLVDKVCTPVGIFAAYNRLKGPKSIIILPFREHRPDELEDRRIERDPKFKHSHKASKP